MDEHIDIGLDPDGGEGGEGASSYEALEESKPQIPPELDFIRDIPMRVTVELARSGMLVRELLQLTSSYVMEMNKLVGEPLEIFVNDQLVARGEVVVINDKFGIRLTDIISPLETTVTR